MIVKIIAGGSGGNVIAVRSNDTIILVEAGLPKTKIEGLLIQNEFDPTLIQAIFISHVHKDHCDGVSIANKYKIPVYASSGSWKKKQSGIDYMDKVEEDLRHVITKGVFVAIDDAFDIECFATHHNDFESLGFVITENCSNHRLSICLDTGIVDQEMIDVMSGSDTFIIEANHDHDKCVNGSYHDDLKARILSDLGHLSNTQTAEALAKIVRGTGERIILTHLSKSNNTPELAEQAVEDALEAKGLERLFDYQLEVVR